MKNIAVKDDITILKALKVLDNTAEKCLLVIDESGKLLGTLTDGDLRRKILMGVKFSEKISNSYNNNPIVFLQNQYTSDEVRQTLREKNISLIPVIDKDSKVVDYLTWLNTNSEKQNKKRLQDFSVVIMAGGKGTRMEPFTSVLPKPLIPIHGKPIIEHIIERFTDMGCSDYHLTVNYKSKILKAYFEELKPDYIVSFIDETKPLGTAGSLKYLKGKFDRPFFVTNCDVIIKADYGNLYEFHNKGGYDITLVVSAKEYIIPYGACELTSEGYFSHINEKPKYDFLINTGLYILNPDVLNIIPNNKFYHITDMIQKLKNAGKNIGVFPIDDDSWIDIGQWEEYKKAVAKL